MTQLAATRTWFHVVNRGARQLPIYGDPDDCRHFLSLLSTADEKTDAEFHAFAMMPNHFHLLVYATETERARAMQTVASAYTRGFNRKYGYDGPLLRARHWREPIDDEHHLLATLAYIHNNPVAASGDHEMTGTYRWTSHGMYLGHEETPSWFHTQKLLEVVGGGPAYRALMAQRPSIRIDATLPKPTRAHLSSLVQIERVVGIDSDSERAAVRCGGRGVRARQRQVAIVLAMEHADSTQDQIADRFGYSSAASLRSAVSRARKRASDEADFDALLTDARARLLR